jgi:hypothetical protein
LIRATMAMNGLDLISLTVFRASNKPERRGRY